MPAVDASDLIHASHVIHAKRLLLLTDGELSLALRQRIGLPWIRTLTLIRLRQDPLRPGEQGYTGEVLASALNLSRAEWGEDGDDLARIAAAFVPALDPDDFDVAPFLLERYAAFIA